jgi:uncharacterized protein (DUF2164 family)
MKKKNSVVLTKERRDEMIAEVRNYFSAEREEEIGDLAAGLILDFIIEKLAPEFYNQGIYDSHQFMCDATEDLLALRK